MSDPIKVSSATIDDSQSQLAAATMMMCDKSIVYNSEDDCNKTAHLPPTDAITTGVSCTTGDADVNMHTENDPQYHDKPLFNVYVVSPDGIITSALPTSNEVFIVGPNGVILRHPDELILEDRDMVLPAETEHENVKTDESNNDGFVLDEGTSDIPDQSPICDKTNHVETQTAAVQNKDSYFPDDATLHDYAVQTFEFEGFGCQHSCSPSEGLVSSPALNHKVQVCVCSFCQKHTKDDVPEITSSTAILSLGRTIAVGGIDMDGYTTQCSVRKCGTGMSEEEKTKLRKIYNANQKASTKTDPIIQTSTSTKEEKLEYDNCDVIVTTTVITRIEIQQKTAVAGNIPPRPSTMPNPTIDNKSNEQSAEVQLPATKETKVTQKVEEIPNLMASPVKELINPVETYRTCASMNDQFATDMIPIVPPKRNHQECWNGLKSKSIQDKIKPFVLNPVSITVTAEMGISNCGARSKSLALIVDLEARSHRGKKSCRTITTDESVSKKSVLCTVLAERALLDVLLRLMPWVWNNGHCIPLNINIDWDVNQYEHTCHYELAPWLAGKPRNLISAITEWRQTWGFTINICSF